MCRLVNNMFIVSSHSTEIKTISKGKCRARNVASPYEGYKNIWLSGWRYIAVINQLGDSGARWRRRRVACAAWRAPYGATSCRPLNANQMHKYHLGTPTCRRVRVTNSCGLHSTNKKSFYYPYLSYDQKQNLFPSIKAVSSQKWYSERSNSNYRYLLTFWRIISDVITVINFQLIKVWQTQTENCSTEACQMWTVPRFPLWKSTENKWGLKIQT